MKVIIILCLTGIALHLFYLLYKQVLGRAVSSANKTISHIVVFTLLNCFMVFTGYYLATSLTPMMPQTAHWISIALFFFIGLKMTGNIRKGKSVQWTFDTSKFNILLLFSLTSSFDAFFTGIALGFYSEYSFIWFLCFAGFLILLLLMAKVMAEQSSATRSVWLIAALGASLIGLNAIIILIEWLVKLV